MKKTIILAVLLIISSCNVGEDCLDYTPSPPIFSFQFIDKTTGDDLFITKEFLESDIKVVDESSANIDFNLSLQAERVVITLSSIGWNLGKKQYTIMLSEQISVKILVKMKSVEYECYTTFEVESFKIENYEYKQESQTGIIQVKI